MRISERAARIKLQAAVEAAGGQAQFLRTAGLTETRWQSSISKTLTRPIEIRAELLAAVGLRRDEHGDIHAPDRPAKIQFVAVHAEGEAAVEAACEILRAVLRPG